MPIERIGVEHVVRDQRLRCSHQRAVVATLAGIERIGGAPSSA